MLALTLQVDGDDTVALQSVLECDEERERLLAKERELTNKTQSRWKIKNCIFFFALLYMYVCIAVAQCRLFSSYKKIRLSSFL